MASPSLRRHPPVTLTIAGHDPLGGSGVAADLATVAALGGHGVVALTAVTAQRLDAVDRLVWVEPDQVAAQLDGIETEYEIDGMKSGLLGTAEVVFDIARRVADGRLPAPVVDPVLVDGRGNRIVSVELEDAYRSALFPAAAVLTPNVVEAGALVGRSLRDLADIEAAGPELAALGAGHVVVTGGAVGDRSTDVVVGTDGSVHRVVTEPVITGNVRGSGCTFSTAVAAGLAAGHGPAAAIEAAAVFVRDRLADGADWTFRRSGLAGPVSHRCPTGAAAQGTSAHSSP
jgi:hydroxymethylpyrimidine/phosphomethylpyrimidine kinase